MRQTIKVFFVLLMVSLYSVFVFAMAKELQTVKPNVYKIMIGPVQK